MQQLVKYCVLRRLDIAVIVVALAMHSACNEAPTTPHTDPPDPFADLPKDSVIGQLAPIDSKISYSFGEEISQTGRTFNVVFLTEKIYSLAGYRIVGNFVRVNNLLTIRLDSIKAPAIGAAIFSPASLTCTFGALPNAVYTIIVVMNRDTVTAMTQLSDTSIISKIQPNNLVWISKPRILRVPRNIVWGQAESTTPSIFREFLDSLSLVGAQPAALLVGDYRHFTIYPDGTFSIPSALGFPYGQHFLFRFDADTSISRTLVMSFAKRYGDAVYIQLTGGRGEQYYSTILRHEQ